MNILETLVQLRDDIKTWVTNNLQALNTKIDEKTIPVDSELSETSANPVQNKVIVEALAGKQPAGDYALKSDVENIKVPNSNLLNGSAEGSLRTIRSMQEDSNYTMGPHAFAEGDLTMAEGNSSHAEGYSTKAFGETCHAEGSGTSADGACSHAEGYISSVEGFGSHAEGFATCAYGRGQHVEGEFNIPDEVDEVRDRGQYLHIAGNGSWDDQIESNAYTLDWSGNAWFSGAVYVGSTSGTNMDEGSKKLATEDFVTAALTALGLPVPTAADAGKILRVNAQGKYELVSIANAEEATF